MKVVVVGSVNSSKILIEELINADIKIALVLSLDEKYSENVSGYCPIHAFAEQNNITYKRFRKINDEENLKIIKEIDPEYIFVTGLSQIVNKEIIESAKIGVIGNHPTALPQYRGRAAIPWQILLKERKSKCSLFFIDEGVDSGDIIDQEDYSIDDNDYAFDVENKINEAFRRLLKRTLQKLRYGNISAYKQDNEKASYLLKRTPEDGEINWDDSVEKIQRLIRASSKPYPGAYSFHKGKAKIIIWKADYFNTSNYIGIPGQIAECNEEFMDIICSDGILHIYDFKIEGNDTIKSGDKLMELKK